MTRENENKLRHDGYEAKCDREKRVSSRMSSTNSVRGSNVRCVHKKKENQFLWQEVYEAKTEEATEAT